MQVSNSVNARYYTQYHINSGVKKGIDILVSKDNYLRDETVRNQRSTEPVDYQEFYKAWMSHGANAVIDYGNSKLI